MSLVQAVDRDVSWSKRRERASCARVWGVGYLVLALVVFDVTGFTIGDRTGRYLLVLVPLFLVFVLRTRDDALTIRSATTPDRFLFPLFAFGLVGSVYGVVFRNPQSPSLAVFVPMALGFLHLTCSGGLAEEAAQRHLRRLLWLGVAYVLLHAGTESGVLPSFSTLGGSGALNIPIDVFRHEKAFLVALALALAWVQGRWLVFAVLVGLTVVLFLGYPAATYLLVALVGVMTMVATGRRSGRWVSWAIAAMALLFVVAAAIQVADDSEDPGSVRNLYFQSVGKGDNNETRTDLWRQAAEEIRRSPLIGSGFTGDISLRVDLSGRDFPVPPHNDVLQMGMGGGLVAMGLFVGWIAAANVAAVRRWRSARDDGRHHTAALVRVLLVGFNAFFTVAMFNPVVAKVGLLATVMVMYTLMLTVSDRARR